MLSQPHAPDAGYNKDSRGASIFKCPNCGLIIDRQKNMAKNILNKFLSMWEPRFLMKGAKFNETSDEPGGG